jgi:hypothetical protein
MLSKPLSFLVVAVSFVFKIGDFQLWKDKRPLEMDPTHDGVSKKWQDFMPQWK